MKQVRILLLLTIMPGLLSAQVNQVDAQGRKQGPWEKVYPGTRVYEYRGQFKDDKPVGKFSYFYKSSKVKAIIKHDDNSDRAEAFFYHENGVIMSHGIYRNMKKDSIWTDYNKQGRLISKSTWYQDLLHGQKAVFYVMEDPNDKSRIISTLMTYKMGYLHGEYKEYFNDNTLKLTGAYADHKKDGVWTMYHPNGKKQSVYRWKKGVKHGWAHVYDKQGHEIVKNYYYYGRLLEGEQLNRKLQQMKELGINPNE